MPASYRNLFLRQSYLDCYDEYENTLSNPRHPVWDYVVLTASGEHQALAYRQQLNWRLAAGKLPTATHYAVLSDPDGKRVGSGGATLHVLREIAREHGSSDFTGLRILVIHSGGDSRRIPQYSACGKLFSPVPRMLPDGRRSTLFDELIICLSGVPARLGDGMLVCSGDVLLLFNPLQIDSFSTGAAVFSMKESADTGKNHGVFLSDEDGNVGSFLHKQPLDVLRRAGAVDQDGRVDIDTGAAVFESHILNDLYTLVDTDEKFRSLVNEEVRLSFYADFLYPLATSSTREGYMQQQPEGEFCPALTAAREIIWEKLHRYSMKLIRFSPAAFLHFGTTYELLRLLTADIQDFHFLDWHPQINTNTKDTHYAVSNSYISPQAVIGEASYIEDSFIQQGAKIGAGCVISGVTVEDACVPSHCVLHGLKLRDGNFVVRMYGTRDNPKESLLFGKPLTEPLWTAPLYPVRDSMTAALHATLACLYGGVEEIGPRLSLRDSFLQADVTQILPWKKRLDDKIKAASLLEAIDHRLPLDRAADIFRGAGLSDRVRATLLESAAALTDDSLPDFSRKIRIYEYLSGIADDDSLEERCFDTLCASLVHSGGTTYHEEYLPAREEAVVRLPVRVNFGGGWSDTPPYCNENGGTVLNAAMMLEGILPIEAGVRRLKDPAFVLSSTDGNLKRRFTDLSRLTDCRNPADPFALHKAALIACGVIPRDASDGTTLSSITARLGGLRLNTRVINIPKGSGLGTSSILAGACVRAIYQYLGIPISDNEVFNRVLCIEQIMSTGGGWQDQVGGLVPGIKMITSDAGLSQHITCTPVSITQKTKDELNERFVLIYTGQRRLARNLLRSVMSNYVKASPDTLTVLYRIQRVAALMRYELERGNVDGFASLLSEHWELSKKLDSGCTNTCIDQIFLTIDDLIEGKMICGAGGGGFLQVVLKKGVSRDVLQKRLHNVFADSGVSAWQASFYYGPDAGE